MLSLSYQASAISKVKDQAQTAADLQSFGEVSASLRWFLSSTVVLKKKSAPDNLATMLMSQSGANSVRQTQMID